MYLFKEIIQWVIKKIWTIIHIKLTDLFNKNISEHNESQDLYTEYNRDKNYMYSGNTKHWVIKE